MGLESHLRVGTLTDEHTIELGKFARYGWDENLNKSKPSSEKKIKNISIACPNRIRASNLEICNFLY
jgi:hypothetical protein